MLENGYVTLPRSLAKKEWFAEGNTLKLYIMLLFNAAFRDTETGGVALKKGQYLTSYRKLAEMIHTGEQQVRTALKHLEATGDITLQSTSKYSIITLNNVLSETPSAQSANKPANTRVNTVLHARISKVTEEKSIEEKSSKEEAAASPPANCSCGINISLITREELIKKYGEETVAFYEKKFYSWTKGKSLISAKLYPTIAKWMAEDIPHAPNPPQFPYHSKPSDPHVPRAANASAKNGSTINTEELRKRVMGSYRK